MISTSRCTACRSYDWRLGGSTPYLIPVPPVEFVYSRWEDFGTRHLPPPGNHTALLYFPTGEIIPTLHAICYNICDTVRNLRAIVTDMHQMHKFQRYNLKKNILRARFRRRNPTPTLKSPAQPLACSMRCRCAWADVISCSAGPRARHSAARTWCNRATVQPYDRNVAVWTSTAVDCPRRRY